MWLLLLLHPCCYYKNVSIIFKDLMLRFIVCIKNLALERRAHTSGLWHKNLLPSGKRRVRTPKAFAATVALKDIWGWVLLGSTGQGAGFWGLLPPQEVHTKVIFTSIQNFQAMWYVFPKDLGSQGAPWEEVISLHPEVLIEQGET